MSHKNCVTLFEMYK